MFSQRIKPARPSLPLIRSASTERFLKLQQPLERFGKLSKSFRRQHDGISTAADIFGDLQKSSAIILFQIEEENLPVGCDFLGSERIRSVFLFWILVHTTFYNRYNFT
jgi:hypothetical protein